MSTWNFFPWLWIVLWRTPEYSSCLVSSSSFLVPAFIISSFSFSVCRPSSLFFVHLRPRGFAKRKERHTKKWTNGREKRIEGSSLIEHSISKGVRARLDLVRPAPLPSSSYSFLLPHSSTSTAFSAAYIRRAPRKSDQIFSSSRCVSYGRKFSIATWPFNR